MKILTLPSWYPSEYDPVAGSFFREQAIALAKIGADVKIVAVTPYSVKDVVKHRKVLRSRLVYNDDGVETIQRNIVNVPRLKRLNYLFRKRIGCWETDRLLDTWRADVIHTQSFRGGDIARHIKRRYKIPYAVTEHSSEFFESMKEYDRAIAGEVFMEADARWAVSDALARRLEEIYGLPFGTMPNSVDTDKFVPQARSRGEDDPCVFATVGYLVSVKRTEKLVRAFSKARLASSQAMRLRIIGDGPERRSVERTISDLGLTDVVELVGALPREQVGAAIGNADCLVVASSVETFGITIIEALSCGVPVIATRCGGPESILEGVPGCFIAEDVEESLVGLLARFAEEGKADKHALRDLAVARYSSVAVAERLRDELEKIRI